MEGLDVTANNAWMAEYAAWVPAKQDFAFELRANSKRHLDGRQVFNADEADGRLAEVLDRGALDGRCRLVRVTVAPRLTKKSPLDLGYSAKFCITRQ